MSERETWFRVEAIQRHDGPTLDVREFYVTSRTAKGVWLNCRYGLDKRWVSNTARKRYAHPTRELAMESFIARKRRQIAILSAQLDNARRALALTGADPVTDDTLAGFA